MPDMHANAFQHRHNRDRSYDSICCTCYLTVATATQESSLTDYEHLHACDPIQLFEVTEYARRILKDLQRITSAANALMSVAHKA